jgi:hypothetical protein
LEDDTVARTVKAGLNPIPGDDDLQAIELAMIDKHVPLIDDLDLDAISKVRDLRQFCRDRRPDVYDELVEL